MKTAAIKRLSVVACMRMSAQMGTLQQLFQWTTRVVPERQCQTRPKLPQTIILEPCDIRKYMLQMFVSSCCGCAWRLWTVHCESYESFPWTYQLPRQVNVTRHYSTRLRSLAIGTLMGQATGSCSWGKRYSIRVEDTSLQVNVPARELRSNLWTDGYYLGKRILDHSCWPFSNILRGSFWTGQ